MPSGAYSMADVSVVGGLGRILSFVKVYVKSYALQYILERFFCWRRQPVRWRQQPVRSRRGPR